MSEQNLVMQSEGLGLRLVQESDREKFYFIESDVKTNQYIKIPKSEKEVEEAFIKFQNAWSEKEGEWHVLAIVETENNDFQGFAAYRYRDKSSSIIEIGWKLHPDAGGQGFATAAARMLMKHLLETYPVHKYVAHCDADNAASERIMQKLGMQKEASFKSNFKIGDTWRDEYAYGLIVE